MEKIIFKVSRFITTSVKSFQIDSKRFDDSAAYLIADI